jgi:hypothetical protein
MSLFTEYLAMIGNGVKNLPSLIESYKNQIKMENGNLKEDEVEEITRRRMICEECPYNSANASKAGVYATQRTDDQCIHCLCPLKNKTACLTCNCGIEVYNARPENNKNQLELKWKRYQ